MDHEFQSEEGELERVALSDNPRIKMREKTIYGNVRLVTCVMEVSEATKGLFAVIIFSWMYR